MPYWCENTMIEWQFLQLLSNFHIEVVHRSVKDAFSCASSISATVSQVQSPICKNMHPVGFLLLNSICTASSSPPLITTGLMKLVHQALIKVCTSSTRKLTVLSDVF